MVDRCPFYSYYQAYQAVRNVSGTGAGNGPFISFHDGFTGLPEWAGFLTGADRLALDYHPYVCFQNQLTQPLDELTTIPCTSWGSTMNTSMSAFGMTAAGEFSAATNDCGLYVNGVGLGARYDGTYTGSWPVIGSCDPWNDWQSWNSSVKADLQSFVESSMDALQVRLSLLQINRDTTKTLSPFYHLSTGSSGPGRSVTLRVVPSKLPSGRTLSVFKRDGSPPIPVPPQAPAVTLPPGMAPLRLRRLVEQAQGRSPHPSPVP